MNRFFCCLFLCANSFVAANSLFADQVVYDNGAGGASGINNFHVSDFTANQNMADEFSVNQNISFDGIRFTGAYILNNPKPSDEFTLNIFLGAGNSPGPNVGSFVLSDIQRTNTGNQVLGTFDVYQYEANLGSSFALDSNFVYWLSVTNTVSAGSDFFGWGAINGGSARSANNSFSLWSSENATLDFQLTQSIPEPSSCGLIAVAGLVSFFARRRKALRS